MTRNSARFVFAVLAISSLFQNTSSATNSTYDQGVYKLFKDMGPFLSSMKHIVKENVTVAFGLSLTDVISLDENEQIIQLRLILSMEWEDTFVKWDKREYNGLGKITVRGHDYWQPDIVIYNFVESEYKAQDDTLPLEIYYNGMVKFAYPLITKSLCPVDVTYYPFDRQECTLVLGSWSYPIDNINLVLSENSADISEYRQNSAWRLFQFKGLRQVLDYGSAGRYPNLLYHVILTRRWSVQGLYLILPNFIMDVMNIVQFNLPCDSNERVGLGVTLFLALLVYLILVEATLPSTETFPLFVTYIGVTLLSIALAEVVTILVLYVHNAGIHDNQREIPRWMRKLVLHRLSKVVCLYENILTTIDVDMDQTKPADENSDNFSDHNNLDRKSKKGLKTDDQDGKGKLKWADGSSPTGHEVNQTEAGKLHESDRYFEMNSRTADKLGGIDRHITHIKLSELKKYREFLLNSILKLGRKQNERRLAQLKGEKNCKEWKQVAMVLDRFFFFIFLLSKFIVWSVVGIMVTTHLLT